MIDSRRYDIDWLRVIAFGLLIPYHVGMLFVSWDWHIKDPARSDMLEWVMLFFNQWRLPLLFLISGIGTSFALKRRSALQFFIERSSRLLIPLIAGILLVVVPQVYIERLVDGSTSASYFDFYPSFFSGIYPKGNFSWHHLWFLPYLYLYSVICIPIFLLLRNNRMDFLNKVLSSTLGLFAIFLCFAASEVLLRPSWPSAHNLIKDWANFSLYIQLFLLGYIFSQYPVVWDTIEKSRFVSLFFGVTAYILLAVFFWKKGRPLTESEIPIYLILKSFNLWCWLLFGLAAAKKFLNRKSTFIVEANRAVYPFYILHQTIIVILAFSLLDWNLNVPIKMVVITCLTFAITFMLYWYLVKPIWPFRILFGVKDI